MTLNTQRTSIISHDDWTNLETTVDEGSIDITQGDRAVYIPRSQWKAFVREVNTLIKLEKTR